MESLIPYLDRHLIFPLLEFLSIKELHPTDQLRQAKYDLLSPTNMTDYISNLWKEINGKDDVPEEFTQKREDVLKTLASLEEEAKKVLAVLENQEVVAALRQDKTQNLQYLQENHGITAENINVLYKFGQFQYNCGNYPAAADLLYNFRALSTDSDLNSSATWGKFAAEILTVNWDGAMEELTKLRESIDQKAFVDPLVQLHQRTWLIHWALFPFFNHENGRDALCELFFSPNYINTIQTSCPWILRYLAAAVITNRSRGRNSQNYQKQIKDLVRVIKQEGHEYSDPITEFVSALYIRFDFEDAQKKLEEAEKALKSDFFLVATAEEFVDAARHLISEAYCRIHQRIDIKYLSTRLNLSQDEGEKWIVNLIRDTRVDAKIDFKEGTVLMNHPANSVFQQVLEKTKGLSFRSQVVAQTIAKREGEARTAATATATATASQ
ncbi:eukaryotic translation initiation factor 3 subunit E [Saitoella coloradoensis]